jgi:hypothetical protein
MHPVLVAALAEDTHRRCPCDAGTEQPHRVCRGCRHGHHLDVHDYEAAPSRRFPKSAHRILKASLFARVVSLLQNSSKRTEE